MAAPASSAAAPVRARDMSGADWPARWVREQLGYEPRDLALFRAALTHRSAAGANNERLEFLGDAVLNLRHRARTCTPPSRRRPRAT